MLKQGNLASTFIVTDASGGSDTVAATDTLWQEIDARFGDFAGKTLISMFDFSEAWSTWEMHPAGDEFVCLLEGQVEMTLAEPAGDRSYSLARPGQFIIVPRLVWHTARPSGLARMLFVTPGQGTENRPEPPGRSAGT